MDSNKKPLILYHGSKNGIIGKIRYDKGRDVCDFGKGFYLGTQKEQPIGLIAPSRNKTPVLYKVELDINGLKVVNLKDDLIWDLFVCYNRKRVDLSKYPQLKNLVLKFETILNKSDVIIGTIADDRMSMVLEDFFNGSRTDIGMLECLKYVNLGKQVVLKTQRACDRIKVISEQKLTIEMRRKATMQHTQHMLSVKDFVEQSQYKDNATMRGHRFVWLLENWGENYEK